MSAARSPAPPRRPLPGRAGRGRGLPATLVAGACLLALALGACSPTQGEDGVFDPQPTTNLNFPTVGAVAVGNQPITLDATVSAGVLDLVAVVNSVADNPTNPDGTFNAAGSVSILRNSWPATTWLLQSIDTRQFPTLAYWADLDGAFERDLVLLDDLAKHVAIYRSTAAGVWPATPTQEFDLDTVAGQMAVVDLDGDGDDDVVVTQPALDIIVTLFNTAGALARVDTTAITGLGRFLARDLDGNGTMDLAALRTSVNVLEIYNGVGDGTFDQTLPSTSIGVDGASIDLAAGDFTGAGHVDVALVGDTANKDRNLVRLLANDGTGLFTVASLSVLPTRSYRIFPTDAQLSGGGQDVAIVHRNERYISFLRANGTSFDVQQLPTTRNPTFVLAGDIDLDGNVDLVTTEDARRTIGVFAGDGAATFTRTQIGLTTHVTFPRLVDVDGDTDLDLIVLEPFSDQLAVFENATLP